MLSSSLQEQSKSDAEKLIADISSLVTNHICRQKEMVNWPLFFFNATSFSFHCSVVFITNIDMFVCWQVDARLVGFRESAIAEKEFLDGHVSSMEGITNDAKRKWQSFSAQAENDSKDGADYSAAKHCRMEVLIQQW